MSSVFSAASEECCLITGGAGNLAGRLAWDLAKQFTRLVLTDVVPLPSSPLPENVVFEKMDIGDFARVQQVLQIHRPNAIVHLASLLSGSSEKDFQRTWHINTTATLHLFDQAVKLCDCRVLFASTLATYGGDLPTVVIEHQPQWPSTLYGVSKVACERLGAYFREAHGLDFRCVRLPVILSPEAPAHAVSAIVSRAFVESAEHARFIFRASPGTRVASLYVKDAITGMAALLQASRKKISQPVYNLSGFTATLGDFSEVILKRLPQVDHRFELDPEIENVLSRWPGALDDSAARRDWAWQPHYDLEATASDFLGGRP